MFSTLLKKHIQTGAATVSAAAFALASFTALLAATVLAEAEGASTILLLFINVVYTSGYFFFRETIVFFICSFSLLSALVNSAGLFLTLVLQLLILLQGSEKSSIAPAKLSSVSSVAPNYSKVALLTMAKVKGLSEEELHRQWQC